MHDDEDIVEPNAAALIESLRAFGYGLATALADLVDNSIFHRSRRISVHFHWAGEKSAIAAADDGTGMDEPTLRDAMRVGSQNPREIRDPADFGRFGLGLKTASFSQCRRVTVFTRRRGGAQLVRCWDLDHVATVNRWQLLRNGTSTATRIAKQLAGDIPHGTVVVWENMDRLVAGTEIESNNDQDEFLRLAELVKNHFGAVFHRLMSGRNAIEFLLNGARIPPWDPFLSDEPATQQLPTERLSFKGETVEVEPFVLPHLSKVQPGVHSAAAGLRGWNAHQGFYVYRNRRLIVPGDWLGIKGWRQEEHYKLARIRVDLPNSLDHDWEIDVTKSRARPPEKLRRELARIGERTRSLAKRVYSFRGAKLIPVEGTERVFVWEKNAKHNQISYRLNREHPLVKSVRAGCADAAKFTALMRLIEETIPVPLITITDREQPDQTVGPFESAKESEIFTVMEQVFDALCAGGLSKKDAMLRMAHLEPFPRFPELLQSLKERTCNE